MNEANIYIPLWQKYRPVIISKMKEATHALQSYLLSKHEFEAIGERNNAGYGFNLEISNGKVINNIEGTAVARDLYDVLRNSETAREIMKDKYFKINMSRDFKLVIQTLS